MKFISPGNPKVLELTKSVRERSYNLSCIQPIKLEELDLKGKNKRLCAWCAITEVFHGNRKYCSTNCSNSAMAWAYPQKEDSLRFLLIRQDWKCADCQFDYRLVMNEIVEREYKRCPETPRVPLEDLAWYYFKRLKRKTEYGRKPEIDHIIPIYKNGESLGIDNHQILCYSCHKDKTKKDLSGKRK